MASFLPSKRGGLKLLFDGFEYDKQRENGDKIYWQCSRKLECKARAHTINGDVVKTVNDHTHGPSLLEQEAKFAYAAMKERSQQTEETNQCIVGNFVEATSAESRCYLPSQATMKRSLRRLRAHETRPHPLPSRLQDVVIPDEYAVNKDGAPFLLHDSGATDAERFIVFCSPDMLALLGSSRQWFADGTFKVAPALFYQLYTVHCKVNGAVIPAVYVLMRSKTEAAYTKLLSVLKSKCAAADPSTVLLDFEQAAINAFRRVFPSCQALGCFFHLCQCVYRKLQSEGLQESYRVDGAFNLMARMIPAIALVPEGDVFDAFEALSTMPGFPPELLPVLDYFEDTFLGRLTARGRRDPRFPASLWNHHATVLRGDAKTTNSVEAWHRGFQTHVQCHQPSLWKFLAVLQKEDALNLHRLERVIMGVEEKSAKKYRESASRLQTLAARFARAGIIGYLKGVANNVSF
ncbi:uncharacterized protein LOC115330735 [Ixodes scapularis]|uniref:uncharacterized protein LOC115330735 n=1 Tax=Ixodes scapularis TaxID=6945 RepID=UPI001A9EF0CA|nr:uncharacterized protein LOC115330735 [Ixodes scapularis]